MSAFGNYHKDEIVESIMAYYENNKELELHDLISNMLEATNYSVTNVCLLKGMEK